MRSNYTEYKGLVRMSKTNKATRKLPPANDWQARNINDWNVTTFHAYLADKHREMFGCEYVPFRGWQAEKGMIGRLIGTQTKKGTHDKAMIKRFIDEAFKTYKPTKEFPGTSFGFIYSYRRQILQRLEAEESRKQVEKERAEKAEDWAKENSDRLDEDLAEWF